MKRRARQAGGRAGTPHDVSVGRDGLATSFVSPSTEFLDKWKKKPSASSFSLNDEARNTKSRSVAFKDNKLRFTKVAFISAGNSSGEDRIDPEKAHKDSITRGNSQSTKAETSPQEGMANLTLNKTSDERRTTAGLSYVRQQTDYRSTTPSEEPMPTNGNSLCYVDLYGSRSTNSDSAVTQREKSMLEGANDSFYVDLQGSSTLTSTDLPPPTIRCSPSPTGSSSGDEIILFPGRGSSQGTKRSLKALRTSSESRSAPVVISDAYCSVGDFKLGDGEKLALKEEEGLVSCPAKRIRGSRSNRQPRSTRAKAETQPAKTLRKTMQSHSKKHNQEDALMADYVANMDTEALRDAAGNMTLTARQLDVLDTSGWEDELDDSDEQHQADSITSFSEPWDKTDLQVFDNLSTSDELCGEVKQVFAKRLRPSGVQYLVVYDGYSADEARWIPASVLSSTQAHERTQAFERAQTRLTSYRAQNSSEESDEENQIKMDVQNDMDSMLDEHGLLDRSIKLMPDEQIARLFSKQEQLGIHSDELLLFDSRSIPPGKRGRNKPKQRLSPGLPSSTLLASALEQDPYSGFDVMDMARPSLRKKHKGRRGNMPLEVSDSELERSLGAAWEHDRLKKKKRKQEREMLRAQGLLGKKGKVDMKAKYTNGMEMSQVLDEVKGFLASNNENLSLPPMGQRERKLVHELANTFGLKSKSIGDGVSRFPMLIRTKHTLSFDEALIPKRISRGFGIFLSRKDKAGKRGPPNAKVARGGGFSKSAVTYQDGDVVGASAPELGQENKGRSMLEKMGWSTGTALGAMNNKGIMHPVTHVVKNSKAGLG